MKKVDVLGWISSSILLLTLIRQVYVQWKTESVAGVSKWLFVGQLAASTGFTLYSFLLHNLVYVCSNIAILLTAILGEGLYLRNCRMTDNRRQPGVSIDDTVHPIVGMTQQGELGQGYADTAARSGGCK